MFFLYAAFPIFYYAEDHLVKDEDGKEQILTALRFIVTAMHLTKGTSPYVSLSILTHVINSHI